MAPSSAAQSSGSCSYPHAQSFCGPKVGHLQLPLKKFGFQSIFRSAKGSNCCVHLRIRCSKACPSGDRSQSRPPHPPLSPAEENPLLGRKTSPMGRNFHTREDGEGGRGEAERTEVGVGVGEEDKGRGEEPAKKTDVSCPCCSGFFPSSRFLRKLFIFQN